MSAATTSVATAGCSLGKTSREQLIASVPRLSSVILLSRCAPDGSLVFPGGGMLPGPSANCTTVILSSFFFTGGGAVPGPSATAAEANDMSNNATAKIFFMLLVLLGGVPRHSLIVGHKYGSFSREDSQNPNKDKNKVPCGQRERLCHGGSRRDFQRIYKQPYGFNESSWFFSTCNPSANTGRACTAW